jgi:ABC-type multidrug transport system permease subunit
MCIPGERTQASASPRDSPRNPTVSNQIASQSAAGFMFPFAGMPRWAQWIGEGLPLTHYLRIVRAILLKGATFSELALDAWALAGLMLVAMTIAVTRFRRTLD